MESQRQALKRNGQEGTDEQEEDGKTMQDTEDDLSHTLDDDDFYKSEADSLSAHAAIFTSPHKNFRIISESVEEGQEQGQQQGQETNAENTEEVENLDDRCNQSKIPTSTHISVPATSSHLSTQDMLMQQLKSRLPKQAEPQPEPQLEPQLELQTSTSPQDMIFQQLKARAAKHDSKNVVLTVKAKDTAVDSIVTATATATATSTSEATSAATSTAKDTPLTPTSPSVPGARIIPNAMKSEQQLTSDSLKKNWLDSYDNEEDNEEDKKEEEQPDIVSYTPFSGNSNVVKESHHDNNIEANEDGINVDKGVFSVEVDKPPSPASSSFPPFLPPPPPAPPPHLYSYLHPFVNQRLYEHRIILSRTTVFKEIIPRGEAGARLHPQQLKTIYSGLVDTAAENNKYNINLTIECLLRPDVPASTVLDIMTKVAKTSRMQKPGDAKQAPLRFTKKMR